MAIGASIGAVWGAALGGGGCATDPGGRTSGPDLGGIEAAEASVGEREEPGARAAPTTDTIVAVVDDLAIVRDGVWRHLGEAVGGEILEEVILEALLERELAERGLSVSEPDVERERELVLRSLGGQAGTDRDEAVRLLSVLRARRGLGDTRFESLLRRNAMLRRMVEGEIRITDSDVERLYRVRYGEKYRIRLLLVPSEREAAEIRRRIVSEAGTGAGAVRVAFAEEAMEHSIDQSAFRGGLIEPFSAEDPAYPDGVRSILGTLSAGSVSAVVALESGFALVYLEERLAAEGPALSEVRDELALELRTRNERVLMDTLAQQLLNRASLTIRDATLARAWNRRRNESP